MSSATSDSTPTPSPSKLTRASGPPRWLVVVLVLIVGWGFWSQRPPRKESHYIAPKLEATLLSRELVPGPNLATQQSTFSAATMAVDAASDRLWILTTELSDTPGPLTLLASTDGGRSYQTPLDIGKTLPHLGELTGQILAMPSGYLYILVTGRELQKKTPYAALLRSFDDGQSWQIWQEMPQEFLEIDPHSSTLVHWNSSVAVIAYATSPAGKEVWAYLSPETGSEITAVLFAEMPRKFGLSARRILPTADQLHVAMMLTNLDLPGKAAILSLDADGKSVTHTELPVDPDEEPRSVSLVEPHPGEVIAAVAHDMPEEAYRLSPRTLRSRLTGKPMQWDITDHSECKLWQWEQSGKSWTRLDHTIHGPRLMGVAASNGQPFLPEWIPDPVSGVPTYRFHQLSTDAPGWLSYWEVEGPASTHPQLLGSGLLRNGEMVLLVDEETNSLKHPLTLWRIALPESMIDSQASPTGSP